MPPLAKELASQFTVYHYDRRGRGDSGNGGAVRRAARDRGSRRRAAARGGSAMVFGISSGAALAGEAVRQLRGIKPARAL
jgi:pimeloyl-ACP methyl ester carboxylesterase